MGRKGVSKQKPHQTKAKSLSKDNANAGVSSVERATGSQPVKSPGADQVIAPAARGNVKQTSDSRKNTKKR